MATNLLQRSNSLKSQLHQILKERIVHGTYPPNMQLPSESELTTEFEVSRPTVRSALNALETEGLIVRRWGIGTFVAEAPPISHPISEALDFHDIIAASGFIPGVDVGRAFAVEAGAEESRDLSVDEGTQLVRVEKVFTASGQPVIYVVNLIPDRILPPGVPAELIAHPEISEPIYQFLEERCNQQVDHHVATLEAQRIGDAEIEIARLDPQAPMLIMKSVAFDVAGRPIFRSLSAYPDKRVKFKLVRQRT